VQAPVGASRPARAGLPLPADASSTGSQRGDTDGTRSEDDASSVCSGGSSTEGSALDGGEFVCDACERCIGLDEDRFHCLLCHNYDLCVACHDVGRARGENHTPDHPMVRISSERPANDGAVAAEAPSSGPGGGTDTNEEDIAAVLAAWSDSCRLDSGSLPAAAQRDGVEARAMRQALSRLAEAASEGKLGRCVRGNAHQRPGKARRRGAPRLGRAACAAAVTLSAIMEAAAKDATQELRPAAEGAGQMGAAAACQPPESAGDDPGTPVGEDGHTDAPLAGGHLAPVGGVGSWAAPQRLVTKRGSTCPFWVEPRGRAGVCALRAAAREGPELRAAAGPGAPTIDQLLDGAVGGHERSSCVPAKTFWGAREVTAGQWRCQVFLEGRVRWVGSYPSAIRAAEAHDAAVRWATALWSLRGESAYRDAPSAAARASTSAGTATAGADGAPTLAAPGGTRRGGHDEPPAIDRLCESWLAAQAERLSAQDEASVRARALAMTDSAGAALVPLDDLLFSTGNAAVCRRIESSRPRQLLHFRVATTTVPLGCRLAMDCLGGGMEAGAESHPLPPGGAMLAVSPGACAAATLAAGLSLHWTDAGRGAQPQIRASKPGDDDVRSPLIRQGASGVDGDWIHARDALRTAVTFWAGELAVTSAPERHEMPLDSKRPGTTATLCKGTADLPPSSDVDDAKLTIGSSAGGLASGTDRALLLAAALASGEETDWSTGRRLHDALLAGDDDTAASEALTLLEAAEAGPDATGADATTDLDDGCDSPPSAASIRARPDACDSRSSRTGGQADLPRAGAAAAMSGFASRATGFMLRLVEIGAAGEPIPAQSAGLFAVLAGVSPPVTEGTRPRARLLLLRDLLEASAQGWLPSGAQADGVADTGFPGGVHPSTAALVPCVRLLMARIGLRQAAMARIMRAPWLDVAAWLGREPMPWQKLHSLTDRAAVIARRARKQGGAESLKRGAGPRPESLSDGVHGLTAAGGRGAARRAAIAGGEGLTAEADTATIAARWTRSAVSSPRAARSRVGRPVVSRRTAMTRRPPPPRPPPPPVVTFSRSGGEEVAMELEDEAHDAGVLPACDAEKHSLVSEWLSPGSDDRKDPAAKLAWTLFGDEARCTVCGISGDSQSPAEGGQPAIVTLRCRTCGTHVHDACCGQQGSVAQGSWQCVGCSSGVTARAASANEEQRGKPYKAPFRVQDAACALCGTKPRGLLLLPCEGAPATSWCHAVCAITIPEVNLAPAAIPGSTTVRVSALFAGTDWPEGPRRQQVRSTTRHCQDFDARALCQCPASPAAADTASTGILWARPIL